MSMKALLNIFGYQAVKEAMEKADRKNMFIGSKEIDKLILRYKKNTKDKQ